MILDQRALGDREGHDVAMEPVAELFHRIFAYRMSQAIHVAAVLGISDQLTDGPQTPAQLAVATGSHGPSLQRLLRALATIGIYEELSDGRYGSTPMGDQLRRDAHSAMGGVAAFIGEPASWQAWGALEHSIRTGENAFSAVHGQSAWEYRAKRPDESAVFDTTMTAQSRRVASAVVDAYDFGTFGTVVDVGGGRGAMLAAILDRYPGPRGVLFDQPHVVTGARALLEQVGVVGRCEIVGGSFFDAVPSGADAYLVKAILHDWPDERAIEVIRACRRAMKPDATLLVIERMLGGPPLDPDTASTALSDLNMLVGPGGKERTRDEYEALLAAAGLRMTRVVPTASDVWVIEARPS